MQIPKNVVQAGDVDSCHKIYIEDYVHTYLSQCRDTDSSADFCLYGKTEKEGDVRYYFIYGAAKEGPGWEITARRYFTKLRRIGEATYDEKEAWLFFEDGYAAPLEGYFIFYEQNEDMQSYLIAVHQNQPGETVQEVVPRAASRRLEQKNRGGQARNNAMLHTEENSPEKDPGVQEPRRILRMPRSYDIDSAEKQEEDIEKIMQAAEAPDTGRPDARAYERKPSSGSRLAPGKAAVRTPGGKAADAGRTSVLSRAAGLVILLVLCAVGVTSINRYSDMKEAGNLFADAAGQPESKTPENALADSPLQVEEKQASLPESNGEVPASVGQVPASAADASYQSPPADASAADAPAAAGHDADSSAAPVIDPSSIDPAAAPQAASGSGQSAGSQTAAGQANTNPADINQANINQAEEVQPVDSLPVMSSSVSIAGQEASGQKKEQASEENREAAQPASDITSEATAAFAAVPASYVVKSGDNLANICRRFYGNLDKMDEICELNSISDPNRLAAGQKIILPK